MTINPENEAERPLPSGEAAQAGAEAGRPAPADVQAYIGRQLRAVYDDVVKQPIPDRFLELMRQLEGRSLKD